MEVIRLNQRLFDNNEKLQGKEISQNKDGTRPYYYSFKRNNNRICIPFRSSAVSIPDKYKVKLGDYQNDRPNSAIDLTKVVVISNNDYLKNKKRANIPQDINNFLKTQRDDIERKFNALCQDYIQAKSILKEIPLTKYSTLQYFHDEIDIQKDIDREKTINAINELTHNDLSERYSELKQTLPSNYEGVLEKYETLNEFKNLTDYPARLDNTNINNPCLIIDKNNNSFNLYADNIEEEPEKHMKEFLNFDIENDKDLKDSQDLDL